MKSAPSRLPKRDLVLIGGGHSHAIVMRQFGMKPWTEVQVTLISTSAETPYSGMIPGHIAGIYDHESCHIDLRALTQFSQVRLVIDEAIGLDLINNQVFCAGHPPISFDLLSIDIGSSPTIPAIPGARELGIPVRPIAQFLEVWEQWLLDLVSQSDPIDSQRALGIIGGGAGGVELSLAARSRLDALLTNLNAPPVNIHLFHRQPELMPNHGTWVRQRLQHLLPTRGITLHLGETVSFLKADLDRLTTWVNCESGLSVGCDRVLWVTQASAPDWLAKSGLAVDPQGFIAVHDTLQSISHPQVFAAGDIASIVNHPCPKAGVFAVRQGKPLFENLHRQFLGQKLQPYRPQQHYLSLLGVGIALTSDSSRKSQASPAAIATWGAYGWGPSPWLWRWKDWIDRRFMAKFQDFPTMSEMGRAETASPKERTDASALDFETMRCAGCASKVGSTVLSKVLQRLDLDLKVQPSDVLIGLDAPDDAAVVQVPAHQVMVHTLDYFRALVDDPFIFGQIAANHCLSDLFAMGATPQTALAIATVPYGLPEKQVEILYHLLAGAIKVLQQCQTTLVGGHTTEGSELVFGLACNGFANPTQLLRKGGMKPGQVLILTKALGTGTLFAAQMQNQAKGRWIDGAIQSMLLSNQAAVNGFRQHQVTACTDITGFGLLGHLLEMARASHVAVELDLQAVPILEGAQDTATKGILSTLQPENLQAAAAIQNLQEVSSHPLYPLLFDPQTSGGLLASLPADQAISCLSMLREQGYPDSQLVGKVMPQTEASKLIKLKI
jgi:selenide,water dikinase